MPELAYKVFLSKLYKAAFKGKLGLGKARYIMGFVFRMPSHLISHVLAEMQQEGWITINGGRFVEILVDKDPLM